MLGYQRDKWEGKVNPMSLGGWGCKHDRGDRGFHRILGAIPTCARKFNPSCVLPRQELCKGYTGTTRIMVIQEHDEVPKQELSMEVLQCEIDFHTQHTTIASFIGLKILAFTINDWVELMNVKVLCIWTSHNWKRNKEVANDNSTQDTMKDNNISRMGIAIQAKIPTRFKHPTLVHPQNVISQISIHKWKY